MQFVAARLLQAIVVVLAVATLTFVLLQLAPGDPLIGGDSAAYMPEETRAQLLRNCGLDRPIRTQYLHYLGGLLRGDFGDSCLQRRPVWDAIRERLPNTAVLAIAALVVDFSIGIALGVLQGTRPGSRVDRTLSAATLSVYSVPVFWLGLMLSLIFAQHLRWLPVAGIHNPGAGGLVDLLRHLFLPALTLGLVGAAGTARYQRAEMIEVMRQVFVRTARARGLRERTILFRHALRNALLPTITLLGLSLPALLSGAVLVETVFSWPGMGSLAAGAFFSRDYPTATGTVIIAATLVVGGNLLADLLYRAVDPRIRGET